MSDLLADKNYSDAEEYILKILSDNELTGYNKFIDEICLVSLKNFFKFKTDEEIKQIFSEMYKKFEERKEKEKK